MEGKKMLIVALILALAAQTFQGRATSYVLPDFPESATPTTDEILSFNSLNTASEIELLNFCSENRLFVSSWLPELSKWEEEQTANEYVRLAESRKGDARTYWTQAMESLRQTRLSDKRRVVDAVLRHLGKVGTAASIGELCMHAEGEHNVWARWKALASALDLMNRIDPTTATDADLGWARPETLAPLLGDLSPTMAEKWAWRLWKTNTHIHYSQDFISTRIWLARFFAIKDPELAAKFFRQGAVHYDSTIRALTIMLLRSGLGGSRDWKTTPEEMISALEQGKWVGQCSFWQAWPVPLSCPLARKHWGGRMDLVWLDSAAQTIKTETDIWIDAQNPSPSGLIFGRIGSYSGVLSTADAYIQARIDKLSHGPVFARHGGIWALTQTGGAGEYGPDGTLYWQCPISKSGAEYRFITPTNKPGQILLLGYSSLTCIDRRGDALWTLDLKGLDDPRWIAPIEDDRFLVCCTKSVGWLDRAGKYTVVVDKLGSASSIIYHPDSPWVINDGSDRSVVIFDPKTNKVTGRFDTNDGGGKYPSRFMK